MSCCRRKEAAKAVNAVSHNVYRPYTLLPFLYYTPTIQQRQLSKGRQCQDSRKENDARPAFRRLVRTTADDDDLPKNARPSRAGSRVINPKKENYQSEHDRYFASDPANQEVPLERPKRNTTMTDLERDAFSKLFRSLAAEVKQQEELNTQDRTASDDAMILVDEVEDVEDRDTGDYDVDRIINRELQLAAPDIEKYPAALRSMAIDAQTKLAQARAAQEQRARLATQDPITVKARATTKWLATKIKSAKTDIELWQVLDKEVFLQVREIPKVEVKPLAQRLDKGGKAEEQEELRAAQRRARPVKQKVDVQEETPDEQPRQTSTNSTISKPAIPVDLSVLRRTYPAALLLAARILANRTQHTPLLSALLPTVRSLHPYSLILGASTALYNEVISYTWRTTSSLSSILALLKDMTNISLTMDIRTWEVLEKITLFRYRALRGDFGEGVKAIEGVKGRMLEGHALWKWKAKVREGLEAVELERSRKEEDKVEIPQAPAQALSKPRIHYHGMGERGRE